MIQPGQWRPADNLELEPNAMSAVIMSSRNVVVSAGPGAGKTELLAQRADFLLRTGLCPYPRRILAVSFKVDAARNLRERVRRRSGPQLAARLDSLTFHAFAKRLIDNFRPALTGHNALDADYAMHFRTRIERRQITLDDLVPLALEIFKVNAYARGGVRQTYSHVFLDEFQDCTSQQYKLIQEAFGHEKVALTAVGDTKQRIMVWAGALDGILDTFATDFAAVPLPLYQNRRSAPRLRRMQNRMIARMDPKAVSPAEQLVGDEGVIDILNFDTDRSEARAIAYLIDTWLVQGVPPHEIAVLMRQQPHLVAAMLGDELAARDIPFRNEQDRQDLIAEPVAALILNFLRVVADERQPKAYAELMRISQRKGASDDELARFDSRLKRMIGAARVTIRRPECDTSDPTMWKSLVDGLLELLSRPVLTALSAGYQQGGRLDNLIEQTIDAFARELAVDADAVRALRRLSEEYAVRLLTIHKCKGLEFQKVVILGVERQLFWGNEAMSEFFVAISRAKDQLVLTTARHRDRPEGAVGRWDERRTPYQEFLDFAREEELAPRHA